MEVFIHKTALFIVTTSLIFSLLFISDRTMRIIPSVESHKLDIEIAQNADLLQDPQIIAIQEKLQTMALREKLAQMIILNPPTLQMTEDYRNFLIKNKPGGVILLEKNISSDLLQFTKDIQSTNPDIPLFICIDQEGGIVKRIQSDANPGQRIVSGFSLDNFCSVYHNTAKILHEQGVNLNFGIVADIALHGIRTALFI